MFSLIYSLAFIIYIDFNTNIIDKYLKIFRAFATRNTMKLRSQKYIGPKVENRSFQIGTRSAP